MSDDSDGIPLEGEPELTPAERLAVRRLLVADARASWARKQLRVLLPIAVACVVGLWQLFEWVRAHISFKP